MGTESGGWGRLHEAIYPENVWAHKVAIYKPFLLKSGRFLRFLNWHETATFGWREPPPIGCGFPNRLVP